MPREPSHRFSFEVSKGGQTRKGFLEAPDSTKAREHLVKKGYTVHSIKPVEGKRRPRVIVEKHDTLPLAGRSEDPVYKPTPGDFIRAHRPSELAIRVLLILGALLGLLLTVGFWEDTTLSPSDTSTENPDFHYEISLSGRLEKPERLKELDATLTFPQLPYTRRWRGTELEARGGRLELSAELETSRRATYCQLMIKDPERDESYTKKLSFKGTIIDLDLGPLRLRSAR